MVDKSVIDTMIAEAGGSEAGLRAVAAVINNRAGEWGLTHTQVVKQPNQFEGYSNPGSASKKAQNDPKVRAAAEKAWNDITTGRVADPTNGGLSFRASAASRGMSAPNGTRNIGGNVFALGSKPSSALAAIDAIAPNPQARPPSLAYASTPTSVRAISVKPDGTPADFVSALNAKTGLNFTPSGNSDFNVTGIQRPAAMPAPRVASLAPVVPQQLVSHPVQTLRIDPLTNKVMEPSNKPSLQDALNTYAANLASTRQQAPAAPPVIRPSNTSSAITKTVAQAGNVALPAGVVPKSVQRDMSAINAMQANRSGPPDDRSSPVIAPPMIKPASPTQLAAINNVNGAIQQPITHTAVASQSRIGPTPSPILAYDGDQATGLPKTSALTAIKTATAPMIAPVPHAYPIASRIPIAPIPPKVSFPSQMWNAATNVVNHSPVGHIAQFATGKPVTGGILAMLQGTPIQAARLVNGGVLSAPQVTAAPPVGSSYLQAQGVDTSNMTAGQVANALNDSVRGAGAGQWH